MFDLVELIEKDVSEGDIPLIIGDMNEDVRDGETGGVELLENSPNDVVNGIMYFNGQVPSSRRNARSIFMYIFLQNFFHLSLNWGSAQNMTAFIRRTIYHFFWTLVKNSSVQI